MRQIVTVTVPASTQQLTTLQRVKLELDIDTTEYDPILTAKIDEASAAIATYLGFPLARETISEAFYGVGSASRLLLNRWPVVAITSATVDGTAAATQWSLDGRIGALYWLDASGYASHWISDKLLTVVYTAGYILPGQTVTPATAPLLPKDIEGACIDLLTSYWLARGRDPMLRAEDIPGVGRMEYWIGSASKDGSLLPPSVAQKLEPYRRVPIR